MHHKNPIFKIIGLLNRGAAEYLTGNLLECNLEYK